MPASSSPRLLVYLTFALLAAAVFAAIVVVPPRASQASVPGPGVIAIAAGGAHTCALTTAGGVKCWGKNDRGQLGDGTTVDGTTPVDVTGLSSGIVALAAGDTDTCALTAAGGVKCWGANFFGQLGHGIVVGPEFCDQTNVSDCSKVPLDVPGLTSGVAAIAAGAVHNCAVTTTGGLKCWGDNRSWQLGDGGACGIKCATPIDVPGLTSGVAAATAAGEYLHGHTCALTTGGGLKCWGYNYEGELGDAQACGSFQCAAPVDVVGLTSGVAAVDAGDSHTCALTTAGGVKCWGWNALGGLLGDGQACGTVCPTPVAVSGLTAGVSAITVGGFHSCARTTGGGVQCWGAEFGSTPVNVPGLTAGVTAITAGGAHACALRASGAVDCWGENNTGQLGDGQQCGFSCAQPAHVAGLGPKPPPVGGVAFDSSSRGAVHGRETLVPALLAGASALVGLAATAVYAGRRRHM